MAKQIILLFTVLVCTCASFKAQISNISITANALVNDKKTSDYALLIYQDGLLKDSIHNKKGKNIELDLEKNKLYSIVFKKADYKNKVVIVNTQVPNGLRELVDEPFLLQVELTTSSLINPDLEDHPVAVLVLSKKEKSLVASESYYKLTH